MSRLTEQSAHQRSHEVRRWGVALSLVGFSALLVPQAIIDPAPGGTGEVMWTAATQHLPALLASAVLLIVSGLLTVPAMGGLLHLARDRGAALATAGAALGVLGGFGHFGIGFYYVVSLALPGGEQAEMVAFIERLNATPALGAIAFPLIIAFGLGMAVVAWAAWRAGLIGWWAPALVTAAVVLHNALPFNVPALQYGTLAALTLVFSMLGVKVARLSEAAWRPFPAAVREPAPALV